MPDGNRLPIFGGENEEPGPSEQVYRAHKSNDDNYRTEHHPKAQAFLDDVTRALAVPVQEKCQHEEPGATRNDGKKDE